MFNSGMRRALAGMVLILALAHVPFAAFAIDASNRYRSPRNPERKVRSSTELIVLHTTLMPFFTVVSPVESVVGRRRM